jgi:ankyrin repeat protein
MVSKSKMFLLLALCSFCITRYEARANIFASVWNGDQKTLEAALKSGADVNSRDKDNLTPLMLACFLGNIDIVHSLIASGADVNLKRGKLRNAFLTPSEKYAVTDIFNSLFAAVYRDRANVVSLLLEKNAEVNGVNEFGVTPLMIAADHGNIQIVQALLEHGADVNAKNHEGLTALFWPARRGHAQVVLLLVQKGADPNLKDSYGATVLHAAVENNDLSSVKILLQKGAEVDVALNRTLWTPLMIAAERGQVEIVKLLLEKKPDLNMQNSKGLTALKIAQKKKHVQIEELITKFDAPQKEIAHESPAAPQVATSEVKHSGTPIKIPEINLKLRINGISIFGNQASATLDNGQIIESGGTYPYTDSEKKLTVHYKVIKITESIVCVLYHGKEYQFSAKSSDLETFKETSKSP